MSDDGWNSDEDRKNIEEGIRQALERQDEVIDIPDDDDIDQQNEDDNPDFEGMEISTNLVNRLMGSEEFDLAKIEFETNTRILVCCASVNTPTITRISLYGNTSERRRARDIIEAEIEKLETNLGEFLPRFIHQSFYQNGDGHIHVVDEPAQSGEFGGPLENVREEADGEENHEFCLE